MTSSAWADWLTPSLFRVRVAKPATEELHRQPLEIQDRIRAMLTDIAELADLTPSEMNRAWGDDSRQHLMSLQLGRVSVRYSINLQTRTLGVEHVIAPPGELIPTA
jgi:hypothetical protein